MAGEAEGEALVTTEKLSHLASAIGNDGVIRMHGHPLMGQSYATLSGPGRWLIEQPLLIN